MMLFRNIYVFQHSRLTKHPNPNPNLNHRYTVNVGTPTNSTDPNVVKATTIVSTVYIR